MRLVFIATSRAGRGILVQNAKDYGVPPILALFCYPGQPLARATRSQNVCRRRRPAGSMVSTSARLGAVCWVSRRTRPGMFTSRCNHYSAVLRMDVTTHLLTVVAGTGVPGYSGDNGPATSAQLRTLPPAVDVGQEIFTFADSGNLIIIRKVSNGVITTVSGGERGRATIESNGRCRGRVGQSLHCRYG